MMKMVMIVLLLLPALVSAFPSGAPTKHCVDLVPTGHGKSSLKTTTPPYRIIASESTYSPGDRILVTVQPTDPNTSEAYFKGIMLQARRASCLENQNDTVGHFELNSGETELKLVNCGSELNETTVSHRKVDGVPGNGVPQKMTKNFTWIAPPNASGHVLFRATIVKTFSIIWLDVSSGVIQDPSAPSLPSETQCAGDGATTQNPSGTTISKGFVHSPTTYAYLLLILLYVALL